MQPTQTRFGPLDCYFVPAAACAPTHVLVICHGFGADAQDLAPVAALLARSMGPRADGMCCVLPHGLLPLAELGASARAWWPIDLQGLHEPQATHRRLEAMRQAQPAGMGAARQALRACLEAVLQYAGLGYNRLILGGFSQGAMLALDVALRLDEAPQALALLSTGFVDEPGIRLRAPRRGGLRVFQSHGDNDPILPYNAATQLQVLLQASGLTTQYVSFAGGHVIAPAVLDALTLFLKQAVGHDKTEQKTSGKAASS